MWLALSLRLQQKTLASHFRFIQSAARNMHELKETQRPKIRLPNQTTLKTKDPLNPLMWKLIDDYKRRDMKRYSNVPVLFHNRVTEMLKYNLKDSFRYFVVTVRQAYELIEDPNKVTPEKLHIADIMQCCLQIALTMSVVVDDIIDESEMRYGKPSWYALVPSRQVALNDSWLWCFLHSQITRVHLSGTLFYPQTMEIVEEFCYECFLGQHFDLTSFENQNLDNFTMEYVKLLGEFKMAPGVFLKPLALALLLTGGEPTDEGVFRKIGADIGFIYIAQNDFLDCYGKKTYGKIGSDIENGKASWLIAKALELADEQQREVLRHNYGKKDPAAVQRVIEVYDRLNLPDAYLEFAEQLYSDLDATISKLPKVGKVYKYALDQVFSTTCH